MRVLVAGWYGKGNLGDQAFLPVIQKLVGEGVELVAADEIPADINSYDALVIGGGSFLDQPIPTRVVPKLVEIPWALLGVGMHGVINPENIPWITGANLVVSRNRPPDSPAGAPVILIAPDLVTARDDLFRTPERFEVNKRQRMLVLPNGFTVATRAVPAWKARALDWFESELISVLSDFAEAGWDISIQPMLATPGGVTEPQDDRTAAMRLMANVYDGSVVAGTEALSEAQLCDEIDKADLVISARYHGCVLAAMAGVRFVGISGHDKFQSFFDEAGWKNWVDLYGFSKPAFGAALGAIPSPEQMHDYRMRGQRKWEGMRGIVQDALFGSGPLR